MSEMPHDVFGHPIVTHVSSHFHQPYAIKMANLIHVTGHLQAGLLSLVVAN